MGKSGEAFNKAREAVNRSRVAIEGTLGDYEHDDTNARDREQAALRLLAQAERAMGSGLYTTATELAGEAYKVWEGN